MISARINRNFGPLDAGYQMPDSRCRIDDAGCINIE